MFILMMCVVNISDLLVGVKCTRGFGRGDLVACFRFILSPSGSGAAMDLSLGFICAYILYETQLIIEKKRTEDTDFLSHCLMLFVDLLYGFIELLRILLEQEEEDEEQEEEEDEEREEEEDEEQEEKENKEREEEEDEEQEEEEIEEQEEDEQLKTLCLFVQSLLA
ncbi:hypothetical protein QYM36_014230 [Artemia franciscana]|uniref:Uncharacterized protein n=1 Tax=Artemia franciscana TaxID=6661 RepID=A0AA88L0T1_ARTSF|nr:hypothetical protein QYM36_014230 [Artemia franciscana]